MPEGLRANSGDSEASVTTEVQAGPSPRIGLCKKIKGTIASKNDIGGPGGKFLPSQTRRPLPETKL